MMNKRTPAIILGEIQSLLDELSFLVGAQTQETNSRGQRHKVVTVTTGASYSGLIGGIRFLIDEGFFKEPKFLAEVVSALHKEGFTYRQQVVSTTLLRLVRNRKLTRLPLSNISSGRGKWSYVERK